MMKHKKIRILFVCLGNICRSPSAEAVMKQLVKAAGYEEQFQIDSAGLIDYHEGEQADPRMRAHAARRGYVLDSISRPVRTDDFFEFDWIIGMDNRNVDELRHRAPSVETMSKIHQMTEFSRNRLYDYVPDPYYSGAEGFELVLDLLEDACQGLLEHCLASTQSANSSTTVG
ncbi:MAG: low molecular weight protein-tyrosine-phosphatase [Parabacteroides sp.]